MPQYIAQFTPPVTDIDAFTRDYLEAIEWLLSEEPGENGEESDRDRALAFAPETIVKAKAVCRDFQEANANDLAEYQERTGYSGGVDLWLTRNHHGAGFWDRGLGALGKRLTDAARLGETDSYVGDDGLIYLM
jgi:hypothetical protein